MTNEEIVYKIQQDENRQDNTEILYKQNYGLIRQTVSKYKSYAEEADLMQEAFLALVKAAQEYDPDREANFATFAVVIMKRDLYRYIQNNGRCIRLSAYMYNQVMKYRRLRDAYLKAGGVEPTIGQVAAVLGITQSQAEEIITESKVLQLLSLDAPVSASDDLEELTLGSTVADPECMEDNILDQLQQDELAAIIWPMVDSLPERQSKVIRQIYQEGKDRQTIATEAGVTQTAVRTAEKEAYRHLKRGRQGKKLLEFWKVTAAAYRHTGVEGFQRTGMSATEYAALLLAEIKDAEKTAFRNGSNLL